MSEAGSPSKTRIGSLDSLRGIAALVVVFYHFSLVVPGVAPRLHGFYPIRIVTAGQTAVLVFFVLSGFVLYLSLQRHGSDDYLSFAARRMTRLYPPVVAAVLLSAALYFLVDPGPLPALDGWLTRFSWTERPGPDLIAGHLLLFDTDRFHTLDNPMWSLVVEVRLSLLFPLLAVGIRWRPVPVLIGCLAVSWLCRQMLLSGHEVTRIDPFLTLQFLDLFAIGAFMARYAVQVSALIRRVPAALVAVGVAATLCSEHLFSPYVMYASAVLLVAASLSYPRLSRFYGLKPFVWLGERSFSLYLVHLPLLLAMVHGLYGLAPPAVILAVALPVCLLGAELFWLAVERPSMQLSRRVGRHLAVRLAPR